MTDSFRKQPSAGRARAKETDRGLTLVEILIAMTISLVLGAVIVAAIVTSLNVASATNDNLKAGVDVRLITSFLARDAQGAAGTDPQKVRSDSRASVSVTAGDWGTCSQAGDLVARFSWVDRVTVSSERTITITWARDGSLLTRQYCENGAKKSAIQLANTLTSAVAQCLPVDCSSTPSSISLTVQGRKLKATYETTLSASLRPGGQTFPTASSASTVSLLALGNKSTPAPCTTATLSATQVFVIGDAVIGDECGATSLSLNSSGVTNPAFGTPATIGQTSLTGNLQDPLAGLQIPPGTPSGSCSGSNPDPVGLFIGNPLTAPPTIYPDAVTIAGGDFVSFGRGRYVFCAGLTIKAGATVTSTEGVLFYVKGGTLTIETGASVDLKASDDPLDAYRNVLVWVPTAQTVNIGTGDHVTRLGGTIYAPLSLVRFTGSSPSGLAVNAGALVAQTVNVSTIPKARFGPIPELTITPDVLGDIDAGLTYGPFPFSVDGAGKALLVNPRWSAVGLAPFTINPVTGVLSGTARCGQVLNPVIRVVDDNGLAMSADYAFSVGSGITLVDPDSYVSLTQVLTAKLAPGCGFVTNQKVTFQWMLSGDDPEDPASWTDFEDCEDIVVLTCSWNTRKAPFEDGGTYDLRVKTTLSGKDAYSNIVDAVTIDNTPPDIAFDAPPEPLSGLAFLSATAFDGQSGILNVTIEYKLHGLPDDAFDASSACDSMVVPDPFQPDHYGCFWDSTLAGAEGFSFDFRASAYDRARFWSRSTVFTRTITNSSPSVSLGVLPSYVRGTVTLTTYPFSPLGNLSKVTIRMGTDGSTFPTTLTGCTFTQSPWSCSLDTTSLTDHQRYYFRAELETPEFPIAYSRLVDTVVDNSVFRMADVQGVNGHCRKVGKGTSTRCGASSPGKIDPIDTLTLTYSVAPNPSSLVPGWNGSGTTTIFARLLDGPYKDLPTTRDLMDFCTAPWTAEGFSCGNANGSSTDPKVGLGSALGYLELNAPFLKADAHHGGPRKAAVLGAAVLVATISVSGRVVTIKFGRSTVVNGVRIIDPAWTGDAKAKNPIWGTADSPKNSEKPNTKAVILWRDSTATAQVDGVTTTCSPTPAFETGALDRDF